MMQAIQALSWLGGAATRAELRAQGVTRHAMDAAVSSGTARGADGALWLLHAPADLVLACRTRSWLGCVSALAHWGMPMIDQPGRPHLATTGHRVDRRAAWHRLRGPVCFDRGPDPRTRCVDPVTAVAQATRCLPQRDALVVVDAALRQRVVTRGELAAVLPPTDPHRGRWVLEHADERAESVIESALRHLLIDGGVTGFEPQARLRGVGRVDLLLDGWLVLEADGVESHSSVDDFLTDRARLAAAARTGYVTLRFGFKDIVRRPDLVLACIRQTHERGRGQHFLTALRPPADIAAGGPWQSWEAR